MGRMTKDEKESLKAAGLNLGYYAVFKMWKRQVEYYERLEKAKVITMKQISWLKELRNQLANPEFKEYAKFYAQYFK